MDVNDDEKIDDNNNDILLPYGLGDGGVAVLLSGFDINW